MVDGVYKRAKTHLSLTILVDLALWTIKEINKELGPFYFLFSSYDFFDEENN